MTSTLSHGKMTSGDKWKAPRPFPIRLAALALVAVLVLGFGIWWAFLRAEPPAPAAVDTGPKPAALSSVDTAGVSALLNQFTSTAHEVRGEISDGGALKANITGSVTADALFGFGTLNVANIDGSTLLADGVVYVKGSPTFWSALGVQTNWPGWVRIEAGFLGDRIFFPPNTVSAALAPVEVSRILGDDYTAGPDASATFGPAGLEQVRLDGYNVSILPADNDGVFGTARPMFDALGAPAALVRSGAAWTVAPPPPPAP